MAVNENTLEQAIIAELQGKGYEYVYGPDITRDYHEVILEDCFRSSMLNINPGITQEIISEAFKEIKNGGLLRLEDLNASFHKYLIEGVPVPYRKDGENRTFTVRCIFWWGTACTNRAKNKTEFNELIHNIKMYKEKWL